MSNTYTQIAELIEFIVDHKLEQQPLEEIARQANLSPAHVQKLFTKWVGVSPKQFGRYLSVSYAKDLLAAGHTLEQTATLSGLSGTGRLHDLFVDIEAMTPGQYKTGELTIIYHVYDSPFGRCLVANTEKGVCNVLFGETKEQLIRDLQARWPAATLITKQHELQQTVIDYLTGSTLTRPIKLHVSGTNFQLKVWEALLSIPEGRVASYSAIAAQLGQPNMSRAVGTAVGSNPIGYMIPCHRVLQASGAISGYRWGIDRKRAMLEYEALKVHH